MAALHASFMQSAPREPGFMVDAEFVRAQRREAYEAVLQQQEDFDARAPVIDGDDWIGEA